MQRNSVRSLLVILIALVLVGTSMVAIHTMMVHADTSRITFTTQTVPLLKHAQLLKPMDSNAPLNISVGLNLRSGTNVDSFLSALNDPQSPQYHHYLTPDQFTQMFSPTSDQVQEVTNYLQSQGLTITSITPNNLLINAIGSVQKVQQSFRTHINTYKVNSRVFHANDSPPSVPTAIGALISSITGMDDSTPAQPLHKSGLQKQTSHAVHTGNAGPLGGLAPQDFLNGYDVTPLRSAGYLGNNQTLAIVAFDGYLSSDVNQYFQTYGITPPNIANVLVGGFDGSVGSNAAEVEFDIEIAGSVAPRANQIIYEGANTPPGWNNVYNKIVTDNKTQIVSISWGQCEATAGIPEMQTLDNIFKQGSAQGISFIAASGDSGAYDCNTSDLAVDSPANDPYVTGVGATHLQINNGTYVSESVWSNSLIVHGEKGWGSGGGLSTLFKLPSWQTGPGVQSKYSNGYRQVPDVTAAGDTQPGYNVYCTPIVTGCAATGWRTAGGTSLGAPLWAASLVLVNQYLVAHNMTVIGHVNPMLYKLFNSQQQFPAFHNVTIGNNLYYPATSGYNMASGIGSPDVYNIARDLAGQVAIVVTPVTSPTTVPTVVPTTAPTTVPTVVPTTAPTTVPTVVPTTAPTTVPTEVPTTAPTIVPTVVPTMAPTIVPTVVPTMAPTTVPTVVPTTAPTTVPTEVPTTAPTTVPTEVPTIAPTVVPTTAPTAVSTAIPVVVPTPIAPPSLLINGGFENGATPWQEQAGQGSEIVDSTNPHVGQYSAYLCGYAGCDDRISQTFTAPTTPYTKITLTYWFYADTAKTTQQCQDVFTSKIETAQGGQVVTLQKSCNTDATSTWIQETYDITNIITSYKGKPAMVMFRGTNANGQNQTSDFYVDDVTITAS